MNVLTNTAFFAHETIPLALVSGRILYDGVQDIKRQKYTKGCVELLLGIGGMLGAGYYLCNQYLNYTPQEQQYSSIEPVYNSSNPQICLFTSYTTDQSDRLEMSRMVAENQRNYSLRHGYSYAAYEENLAPDSLPYWSKIAGIRNYLAEAPLCQWIVWLDDDALVTNPSIKMEEFIERHAVSPLHPPNVLVTQDVYENTINTGVLIVRNCEESRGFFNSLWDMRHHNSSSAPEYTYGSCPHQKCLHEQEAMQDLMHQQAPFDPSGVRVIAQHDPQNINRVGLNTFSRFDHYDVDRDMLLYYEALDREENRYRPGDFIAQCTGLATNGHRGTFDEDEVQYSLHGKEGSNLRFECIQELARDAESGRAPTSAMVRIVSMVNKGTLYGSRVSRSLHKMLIGFLSEQSLG